MKTRLAYIFACLCAAAVLSSCDKDPVPAKHMEANLTVKLMVENTPATKTTGSETEADLDTESYISSVRLFSVASDLSSVTEITELEFTPGSNTIKATIPSDRATGLLYVIANCPSWLTIDTSSYANFVGSYSGANANIPSLWADNNFMMVNLQNGITDSTDKAGVAYDTNSSLSPIVHLERLAVKIKAEPSESINCLPLRTNVMGNDCIYTVMSMAMDGVALLNCVNSFNLVQSWAQAKNWTADGCVEQILQSPSYSTDYSRTDGYYDNVPANLTFYPMDKVFYCLENDSPVYDILTDKTYSDYVAGTKMKGRVTALVFRVQVKTASEFNSEVIINEPLYPDPYEGDWTIITRAGSTDEEARTLFMYKGLCYADVSLLPESAKQGISGLTDYAKLRENGVSVYEDGYMYYTYWIEDTNYTDGGESYLSVMRNTSYNFTVNSIDSFGDDIPCGEYIDTDPILKATPKIKVSLKILDWNDVSAHYTL